MSILTKSERIALYQKLHKNVKHYYCGRGMCNELKALGHSGNIEELPELWAKKPKTSYSGGYWWQNYKTVHRLRAIAGAIKNAQKKA